MSILSELEPREVLRFFEAICDLPHGSGNTKILSDYCAVFARVRGLRCQQDKAGNVIIWKNGTHGYEDHPPVIIQGHLDMVCEKEPDCKIDFRQDGLDLYVEDGYIRAKGTTLGGDDGIAVAYALALLDSRSIPHPPLEIVLTTDEEIGMLGAAALDTSPLKGKLLLNIDSEDEGVLTVSCAGGVKSTVTLPIKREKKRGVAYTVEVNGLRGGHSGVEINEGRENAILFSFELLRRLSEYADDLRIADWNGGGKDNAIPRNATFRVLTDAPLREGYEDAIRSAMDVLREKEGEASAAVKVEQNASLYVLTKPDQDKLLRFFAEAPNGVQAMSEDIRGLVQTSLNLGILTSSRENITLVYALRSSVNRERTDLADRIRRLAGSVGAKYSEHGAYPAWEYRKNSPLRETMQTVFRRLFGGECRILAIHAGLECGLFADKIRDLDCVSFGPDMRDIHTPREALSITSVQRTWLYLTEILKSL